MSRSLQIAALAVVTLSRVTPAWPCSIFTAHDTQTVLVGDNEDWYLAPTSIIWFVPASPGKHGYVAWGFDSNHYAQGGMNDQGLFFDGLATPQHTVTVSGAKPFTLTTPEEVLQVSATLDEALTNLAGYDLAQAFAQAQLLFVDRTGASAIFDGDTVTKPTGTYQIGTNFLPAHPELGAWPCPRYITLKNMMEQGLKLTPEYFRDMARAAQQGTVVGTTVSTRYTTVADLKMGKLWLYYERDFDNPVVFDLAAELAKGAHEHKMSAIYVPPPDQGVVQDAGADLPVPPADAALSGDNSGGCRFGAAPGPAGWPLLFCLALVAVALRLGRAAP